MVNAEIQELEEADGRPYGGICRAKYKSGGTDCHKMLRPRVGQQLSARICSCSQRLVLLAKAVHRVLSCSCMAESEVGCRGASCWQRLWVDVEAVGVY